MNRKVLGSKIRALGSDLLCLGVKPVSVRVYVFWKRVQ